MRNDSGPGLSCLAQRLRSVLGQDGVQENQPLARHTALQVGGPADLLVTVTSRADLEQVVTLAREHQAPCRILGSGANVLVSDQGVRGLVILNRAREVAFGGAGVQAESGATFAAVARMSVARGLAGLEWAVGIPGTVGGAVVGNAGAWGGSVATTLVTATILETDGQVTEWPVSRFGYGYRCSALKQEPPAGMQRPTVLAAEFALQAADPQLLKARVAEIQARRKATQPPGSSCGSVFRNPPGDYAGRLIEAVGLKGQKSGGAEVSPRHANFIINHGGASARDVKTLIDLARERVRSGFGVWLELEIELIGDWEDLPVTPSILPK